MEKRKSEKNKNKFKINILFLYSILSLFHLFYHKHFEIYERANLKRDGKGNILPFPWIKQHDSTAHVSYLNLSGLRRP